MLNLDTLIRFSISSVSILLIFMYSANQIFPAGQKPPRRSLYKAYLLADADSGRILLQDRIHNQIFPASLVKMMVALITLEEIESGSISLQDSVIISEWASKIGGHQVYLKQGEIFSLYELMKATVIGSANDAAVAVAEHVMGNDKVFIKKMNERARELGMKNTRFNSVHGLPPGRNQKMDVSSAYDFYLLSLELLKHPQFLNWSSTRLESFRNGTFQLLNTNHRLIKSYNGMEGMKTGYHRKAGFNLVSTAIRKGKRFISIVLGAKSSRIRSKSTKYLLDYGFNNFLKYDLNKKEQSLPFSLKVEGGVMKNVSLQISETTSIILSPDERKKLIIQPIIPSTTEAPVKEKQKIGRIEYWLNGKLLKVVALQTEHAVPKQNIFSGITGMFTNLADTN